jgi:hypothetical protein
MLVGIIIAGALVVLTGLCMVIVDKILFDKKLKQVKKGMTGKEISKTGLQLKIENINPKKNTFEATIHSKFKFYKYRLYFVDGKYQKKVRLIGKKD